MKWPISVSPYEVAIIPMISKNDNSNLTKSQKIYKELIKHNTVITNHQKLKPQNQILLK